MNASPPLPVEAQEQSSRQLLLEIALVLLISVFAEAQSAAPSPSSGALDQPPTDRALAGGDNRLLGGAG